MQYLTQDELTRLLTVAYQRNRHYHLALLVGFWHGARVSEINNLRGTDFTADGSIILRRLKGSRTSVQPIHRDDNPIFDESPVLELARTRKGLRLWEITRQRFDQIIKSYCVEADIHPAKAHMHCLKHTTAMTLWGQTQSLGMIQSYLGHVSAGSTLAYLYEADASKAQSVMANVRIG
ncbi:MAG TPA: tyrosine-type recombinase/integrase [Acidobacteriaceae bacterium]|jgi:integrase|nr:tyrosine-type recombinase/integrase [Acidobacteriaceae bacterium]